MDNLTETELEETSDAFAAIGSKSRLEVLKVLIRAGTDGLTIGEIQRRTDIPASTLAHHLRSLRDANLVVQLRQGRTTVTSANYLQLQKLAHFILSECCADRGLNASGDRGGDNR